MTGRRPQNHATSLLRLTCLLLNNVQQAVTSTRRQLRIFGVAYIECMRACNPHVQIEYFKCAETRNKKKSHFHIVNKMMFPFPFAGCL